MKKFSKSDINLKEWEFEFQQRNSHPILMADFWCRALYHKYVKEINLVVDSYDYLFTGHSKGYAKIEQKKKTLEAMKGAFEKDKKYQDYIYTTTIKRVNEFDKVAEKILKEIIKKPSSKYLIRLWKEFDSEFITLIPWYWIPYYVAEQDFLSNKMKESLVKYKEEIEKVTDFNNAFLILISHEK